MAGLLHNLLLPLPLPTPSPSSSAYFIAQANAHHHRFHTNMNLASLISHNNKTSIRSVLHHQQQYRIRCQAREPKSSANVGLKTDGGTHSMTNSGAGVKHLVDTASELRTIPPEFVLPIAPISPSPKPSAIPSIPVIDIQGLDGSAEQRMFTTRAISSACEEWGFFRIVNHGIKSSLVEEMMRSVNEFFCLPWEEKVKYASNNEMDPVRYGTSMNTSQAHVRHWRDYLRHFGKPFEKSYNLWPANPPNYRKVAKEYLTETWSLATKITAAISEDLGLDKDYIEKSLGEGCQIVAANYYPPCPQPHLTLGLSGHSDHGGLIILTENGVAGLQVKYNGVWVPVQHVPGTFVVNVGDYLEILSNGRYKSIEHRAVVNEHKTRISVAVSLGPELNAIIGPAEPLLDDQENKSKYKPIMYKDYMKSQQRSTIRGKDPLSTVKTSFTS